MSADAVNRLTDLVSLTGNRLRKAGAGWWAGPCPFCDGVDRFVVKDTPKGQVWYCRRCGDGKYHTAVDFVMKRDGVGFQEALKALGGDSSHRPQRRVRTTPRSESPAVEPPPADWQKRAWAEVSASVRRLTAESPAGRYLQSRGLDVEHCACHLLGDSEAYGRPCVVIPYIDADGETLWAVRYRFLDGEPRYLSRKGSRTALFGLLHVNPQKADTLIVCEGELNALSIRQACDSVDVVSVGSQTVPSAVLRAVAALARRYRRTVVWADEPEAARRLAKAAGAHRILRSPVLEGVKLDANALLQRGLLEEALRLSDCVSAVEHIAPTATAETETTPQELGDLVSAVELHTNSNGRNRNQNADCVSAVAVPLIQNTKQKQQEPFSAPFADEPTQPKTPPDRPIPDEGCIPGEYTPLPADVGGTAPPQTCGTVRASSTGAPECTPTPDLDGVLSLWDELGRPPVHVQGADWHNLAAYLRGLPPEDPRLQEAWLWLNEFQQLCELFQAEAWGRRECKCQSLTFQALSRHRKGGTEQN